MEKQCHQCQHSQIAGEASGLHRAGLRTPGADSSPHC